MAPIEEAEDESLSVAESDFIDAIHLSLPLAVADIPTSSPYSSLFNIHNENDQIPPLASGQLDNSPSSFSPPPPPPQLDNDFPLPDDLRPHIRKDTNPRNASISQDPRLETSNPRH